jgi:hypothetical protein
MSEQPSAVVATDASDVAHTASEPTFPSMSEMTAALTAAREIADTRARLETVRDYIVQAAIDRLPAVGLRTLARNVGVSDVVAGRLNLIAGIIHATAQPAPRRRGPASAAAEDAHQSVSSSGPLRGQPGSTRRLRDVLTGVLLQMLAEAPTVAFSGDESRLAENMAIAIVERLARQPDLVAQILVVSAGGSGEAVPSARGQLQTYARGKGTTPGPRRSQAVAGESLSRVGSVGGARCS